MEYDFNKWDVKLIQEPNELLETLKTFNLKYKKIKSIQLIGPDSNYTDYLEEIIYNRTEDEELGDLENFKDDYMFDRFIEIDEPIIIEFESGDKLEIDYSECGSLKVGLNSLPNELKSFYGYNNLNGNVIFSNCLGEQLNGFAVHMQDEFELSRDFTGAHGIEEPKDQKSYVSGFSLVLSNHIYINFTNFFDYGYVWISDYLGKIDQIAWKELKNGIIADRDTE